MSTSAPEVVARGSYRVTSEAIVRYAGASGDFTPIHYDPAELARAGHETFFAMGMLVAGRLGALASETFGGSRISSISVRFRELSLVGSLVTMTISRTSQEGRFELEARDDSETVIATGGVEVAG